MLGMYMAVQDWVQRRLAVSRDRQSGASAVEYGLLIGLIAIAVIAVLVVLGPKLAGMFTEVETNLPTSGS
ncbi:Flp family type IVb pilin [Actinophytocola sp.]|uniref:Flp family type IVb pilin n=1 Tax=Actinophytocola sp. TaxID=1872138 RepID=UPI002ED428AD